VLKSIAASGQTHKMHLINALRCSPWEGMRLYGAARSLHQIWGSGRFLRFCTEGSMRADARRSIHIPYCPHSAPPPAPPPVPRDLRVVYVGGSLLGRSSRRSFLNALHAHADISRALVILSPTSHQRLEHLYCDTRHPLHLRFGGEVCDKTCRQLRKRGGFQWPGELCDGALTLMDRATYTMCPPGDAPDSPRVYSALRHGSIPLVDTDRTNLPPLLNWNSYWTRLSAPLHLRRNATSDRAILELPAPEQEAALLQEVHKFQRAIDCEPGNSLLSAWLEDVLEFVLRARRDGETGAHGSHRKETPMAT